MRDAVEGDLPAIVQIYNHAIATRISTAQLEPVSVAQRLPWFHEHARDRHPLWIVELDGTIAGWFSFHSFIPRCAYRATAEISVYVHEEFRSRGVGWTLLSAALDRSPALGFTALLGLIFAGNTASLELFERAGFTRWGLLPGVAEIEGFKRDVVILGRHVG